MEDDCSSMAFRAHQSQNLDEKAPDTTRFPGHDIFQNGVLREGAPSTFYVQATDADIKQIQNHESTNFSGCMTDQGTVDACTHNGVLNANELSAKVQTAPWRPSTDDDGRPRSATNQTPYTYRENVAAFNVNWDNLNAPKNAELKQHLCNPDGLSPDGQDIKMAFGQVQNNPQWGEGGGNQYFVDKATFNEAVNAGVFEYNPDKSFREGNQSLCRSPVSAESFEQMSFARDTFMQQTYSKDGIHPPTSNEAKAANKISPAKESAINFQSAQPPMNGTTYQANPDPTYGYKNVSTASPHTTETRPANKTVDISQTSGLSPPSGSRESAGRQSPPSAQSQPQASSTRKGAGRATVPNNSESTQAPSAPLKNAGQQPDASQIGAGTKTQAPNIGKDAAQLAECGGSLPSANPYTGMGM